MNENTNIDRINDYKIIVNDKTLNKNIADNQLISDVIRKCDKYKNNIFNMTSQYEYDKVYGIGDIHGDFEVIKKILFHIGCIIIRNNKIEWNPKSKNICIVQVGDIIDGYRPGIDTENYVSEDLKIIRLLLDLDITAQTCNSRIILLYGNHEINNLFNVIDDIKLSNYRYSIKNNTLEEATKFNKELKLLKSRILCNYHTIILVNGYIFCHAGFVLKIIEKLLKLFGISHNDFIQLMPNDKIYLINACSAGILHYLTTSKNNIQTNTLINQTIKYIFIKIFQHRNYEKISLNKTIHTTDKIELDKNIIQTQLLFNTKGMIIGHNITYTRHIQQYNNLFGIDIAMSRAFGNGIHNIEYIEIEKNKNAKIISINYDNKYQSFLSQI